MATVHRVSFALGLLALAGASLAAPGEVTLATREHGELAVYRVARDTVQRQSTPAGLTAPLGSVWKLFVYSYVVAQRVETPDYTCKGGDPEEVYCCDAGGSIDREAALVRSCGRFFAPQRLKLDPQAWQSFWQAQHAPAWLTQLSALRESTRVPVPALLDALDAIPADARRDASQTLLGVLMQPNAGGAVGVLGSGVRAKTWTLPDPQHAGQRIGGAAGWFADGQPFWLGGSGVGIAVLRQAAPALASYREGRLVPDDAACVEVRFFERYPLKAVLAVPAGTPVVAGPLTGRLRAVFANGNSVEFASGGELSLRVEGGHPVVMGHLGVNDYVARVIDREGAAQPAAAAAALAVAARSYLAQEAARRSGCYVIGDSSATQRVSPRPASAAARKVADWTSDLVVQGVPVRYHLDKSAPGLLSWRDAVAQAQAGASFEHILARAFPGSTLGGLLATAGASCRAVPQAQRWLAARVSRWRHRLNGEAGYAEPDPLPVICMGEGARPYADTERHRLYVRGWQTQEDRIALTHEYLHVAFEGHPRAQDEALVERLARGLILEEQ